MHAVVWGGSRCSSAGLSHGVIVELTRQIAAAAVVMNHQSEHFVRVVPLINLVPAFRANPMRRHEAVALEGAQHLLDQRFRISRTGLSAGVYFDRICGLIHADSYYTLLHRA